MQSEDHHVRPSNRHSCLRACGALLLGGLFGLVVCELVLRTTYYSPGQWRLDPVLGQDRVPHSLVLDAGEGGTPLHFDRYGLNNDDAVWDRVGRRVALLGDSYVEAEHLPRPQNFASLLGQAWPGQIVLNLGRYGLSPPQMVALYRRMAAKERLDFVVLSLSDDDIIDLEKAPPEPGCGLPEQSPGWRRRLTAAAAGHLVVLQRLQQRARDWARGTGAQLHALLAGASHPADGVAADHPDDGALAAMLAECISAVTDSAPAAVVLLPGNADPAPTNRVEHQALERRLRILHEAVARSGATTVIDARAELGEDPLGDGRLIRGFPNNVLGDGHLNALGHAVLAGRLAAELRPALGGERREIAGAPAVHHP